MRGGMQQQPERDDAQCPQQHPAAQRRRVAAGIDARAERERDRHADDEEEEWEHEVGRCAAVPRRVFERREHMAPVARVVDEQHRGDRQAAQRIDRIKPRGHSGPAQKSQLETSGGLAAGTLSRCATPRWRSPCTAASTSTGASSRLRAWNTQSTSCS